MTQSAAASPVSLQVFRYEAGDSSVRAVIGEVEPSLPQEELVAHAHEALTTGTFVCYAVSQENDFVADELCFVPQGRRCDILSIRTNGWQRHHGDHRRSLVEILNNLAAAVACGKLYILDEDEVGRQATAGEELLDATVGDTAALAAIRDAVDVELAQTRLDDATRRSTILCLSEAVTNMLLHGGGKGRVTLRRLPSMLRIVVADEGPGLNFLNWIEPPAKSGQASMGYGFKIILDNLDAVSLRTTATGTTLILDRKTD